MGFSAYGVNFAVWAVTGFVSDFDKGYREFEWRSESFIGAEGFMNEAHNSKMVFWYGSKSYPNPKP